MQALVFIYLGVFLLDGLLAVGGSIALIGEAHRVVAGVTLGLSVVLFGWMACRPAVPKWQLLPAVGWSIWSTVCGGFPLAFVAPESADAWLAWGQLGLGLLLGGLAWRQRLVPPAHPRGFSARNFFGMAALAGGLAPVVLVSAAINFGGRMVERATDGYVRLRPAGVMLEEREFARDGRRVRLVGMMHVGDADFYERVQASLPSEGRAVVLLEGVTDKKALLKEHFSYGNVARRMGLAAQETSGLQRGGGRGPAKPGVGGASPYQPADVDVSAFRPQTIAFLNAVARLLSSATLAAALEVVRDPASPFRQPDADVGVQADLLDRRNEHLAGEIEAALRDYDLVVVPWGAMHLPFIENFLAERGFRETRRASRPAIRWWTSKP